MYLLLIEQSNMSQTESLLSGLQQQGHQVMVAHTPQSAADQASKVWPNLVVVNLPDVEHSFLDFHRALDGTNLNIPRLVVGDPITSKTIVGKNVMVISAKTADPLKQGIDKAVSSQKGRFMRLPGLVIDFEQRQVLRGEQMFPLTPKEFKLLHLLIANSNQVLSRKTIMQNVWETEYMGDTRTLDVHIRWVREKIEENPSRPERLVTIRGVGYRFVLPDPEAE